MFKKATALFIVLIMITSAFPQMTFAATVASGMCGENVSWALDSYGTLTISGTGDMYNPESGLQSTWYKNNNIKKVVINDGVTSIGAYSFLYCENLSSISIPYSVSKIEVRAFGGTSSLKSIVLPDRPLELNDPFYAAWGLESIVIPDGVSGSFYYGDNGFASCYNLKSVKLPDLLSMPCFIDCRNLETITIPDSVSCFYWGAFYGCSSLKTVIMHNNISFIDDNVFDECGSISRVYYTGNASNWNNMSIGSYNDTFKNASRTYNYSSYSTVSFNANGGTNAPSNQTKTYGAPLTLTSQIPVRSGYAFCGWATSPNAGLDEVLYQPGDTYLNNNNSTLYAVWTPGGQCGANVYWKYMNNTLYITGSGYMDNYTSSVNVPWKDYTSEITDVLIDDGISSIGDYAFSELTNVKEIYLPFSVNFVGNYAFLNCTSLESFVMPEESAGFNIILDTSNPVYVPTVGRVRALGSYVFSGCSNLKNVSLTEDVSGIGDYAFSGCRSLAYINIPSKVPSISSYTFYNCSSLADISLPDNLKSIGEGAFRGCSSLTLMNLPIGIKAIGAYAFSDCSKMTNINLPQGITVIEPYTFNGDSSLKGIMLPDTLTKIKEFAFSGCSKIPSVVIPENVTEIQRGAFLNCSALETATIPDTVLTMGTSVFSDSGNLTIKCYVGSAAYNYAVEADIPYELMSYGAINTPLITTTDIIGGVRVEITSETGKIYYTTNGTTPEIADKNLYKGPFSTRKNMTISAIAVADGWENSEIAVFYVNLKKASTPYSNAPSGKIPAGTKIELYCETDGAEIWYTTDGNIPTEADVYTGGFEITENTTVYAVAVKEGMITSALCSYYYEVSEAEDIPMVTTLPASDITETTAKLSASVNDNKGEIRMVEFIYYEKNNSSAKYYIQADDTNSIVVTGLTPNTEYWYQARALNELGWSPPGYIEVFKTKAQGVIEPASVSIKPSYLSMNIGKKKTLLATVLPAAAENRDVFWSSEDTSVAIVNENGVVTAKGLGNTRIKATTVANRLVAYCNIDVISSDVRGELDFSEHNMITNSSSYDEYGFDHGVNDGGNALMASAYLARWDGAVLEENDVYPDGRANVKYKEIEADYHVQNIIYLPYRMNSLDNDEIKNAIMKYGPVYTSFQVNWEQFDKTQTNYYYPDNLKVTDGGHAIVIVGWDDNYSRKNFVTPPPGDGAFICKNSWGTESGENGYFYISYYDKYIAREICGDYNAVFYDVESYDNYNKIYQYDYLGPVAATNEFGQKSIYTANVFPESGSTLEEDESLKAVSFYNYAPGMSYEIYVVTNYKNSDSLKNIGSPVKSGVSEYAGYITVNLDNAIELLKGTRFAVVVKATAKSGDVTIFVELPVELNNGKSHSSNARANKDESYIGMDKKTWMDYTDFYPNANLCIKAFTETSDRQIALMGIDNVNREYTDDTVLTIDEWKERGMIFNDKFTESCDEAVQLLGNTTIIFGSMLPSVLPDLTTNNYYSEGTNLPPRYDLRDEGCMTPVKHQQDIGGCWSFATYASLESSVKKASASSISTSADKLSQATNIASSITLETTGTIMALGNKMQLKATVLPFDSTAELVWKSSNNRVVSVSAGGLVTALGVGNATVTVSTADGSKSAECAITVTTPEKVDNITINNKENYISAGNRILMDYSVYPENAGDKSIIWEVDDESVASVNEYGILTAKSGGTVTVTAYSSDRSVCDTYVINVDDGHLCNVEITDNSLGVYDTNIFGSVSLNVVNKTSDSLNGTVVMGIYDSEEKLVNVYYENKTLSAGNNPVIFKNIYIPGIIDKNFSIKVFVWDNSQKIAPLAVAKEDNFN